MENFSRRAKLETTNNQLFAIIFLKLHRHKFRLINHVNDSGRAWFVVTPLTLHASTSYKGRGRYLGSIS